MFIFVNTDWETGDYTDFSNDLEYFDTNNLTAGSAGVCPQSYALDLCLVFFRSSLACMCPSVSQYCNIAAEAHSDSAQSVGDCGSVEISPAVRTLHADLTCNTQPPHGWPAQDSLPPLVSTLQADHHHHSYMLDLGARVPHLVNYLEILRPEYVVVGTQMII